MFVFQQGISWIITTIPWMLGGIGGMGIFPQTLTICPKARNCTDCGDFPACHVHDTVAGNIPMIIPFGIPIDIPWISHHAYIPMIFPSSNQDSIESHYMMLKFQAISQRAAILEALLRCRSLWAAESDDHDLVKAATTGIPPWLWKPQDLKKYRIVFLRWGFPKSWGYVPQYIAGWFISWKSSTINGW